MRRWWRIVNFASAAAVGGGYALGVLRPENPLLLLLVPLPAALAVIGSSSGAPVLVLLTAFALNLLFAIFLTLGLGVSLVGSLTTGFQPVLPMLLGLFALFSVNTAVILGLLSARGRG